MPTSYGQRWSIFRAWKAACLNFANPDISYELDRRAV